MSRSTLVATIVMLVGSVAFNMSVTNLASLYILGDIGGSPQTAYYSIAYFALGASCAMSLGLFLSRRLGKKVFLKWTLSAYILLTFATGLSSTYPIFIILRCIQGYAAGSLLVVLPSLLSNLASDQQRTTYIARVSIVMVAGSVGAAAIGGTLAYYYNWRTTFFAISLIVSFLTGALFYQLKDTDYPKEKVSFDIIGYIFLCIGLLSLGSCLTLAEQLDYFRSPLINFLCVLGSVAFLIFIFRSHAVFNPHLLKNPTVLAGLFVTAIVFATYSGSNFLLSQWLKLYVNYTPEWIMTALGTMAITICFIMLLLRHMKANTRLYFLFTAVSFLALSSFYSAGFNVEINIERLIFSNFLTGVGYAFILPPLLMLILGSCTESEGLDGLLLFQMTRIFASGLGGPIYNTLWTWREEFYRSRLDNTLTWSSPKTTYFLHKFTPYYFSENAAIQELNVALDRQAHSLALNDIFYLMGWIFTLTIGFILLYNFVIKPRLKPHLTI